MGLNRASNFASRKGRPVFAVGATLWALGLAALALLAVALSDVARLQDDVAQLSDHTARLSEQAENLRLQAENAPDVAALKVQSERVQSFNALTGPRRAPLVDLLAMLEESLPRGVWISQLNYNVENGRLSVSLRTDQETELPVALRALEAEATLRDVILERQLRLQQGGRQLAQYDIEAEAR